MVRLLTFAAIALFANVTVIADPLSGISYSSVSGGAKTSADDSQTLPLRFQLSSGHVGGRWNVSDDLLQPHFDSMDAESNLAAEATGLRQYDAALLYPVVKKGMNFNLGFNIRVIDGQVAAYTAGSQQRHNFREAVPMFYAAALFDLPFKGLSAGFIGRHSDSLINPSFDYKARLSYEWAGGLGLEGGWQHQQYANDQLNQLQRAPDSKGLFLDLRLRF